MKKHIKRLGKHSAIYTMGDFIYKGIIIFLIPVYTRYLSTSSYGIIETVRAISSILIIVYALGLDSALARFYFDYKKEEFRKYIGTILITILSVSLASSLIFTIVGAKFSGYLIKQISFNPYLKLIIWRSFFGVLPITFLVFLQIQEKSGKYVFFQLFQTVISISIIIYFVVFLKQGAVGQVKGMLYSSIILFIITLCFFAKNSRISFSGEKMVKSLKYGLPLVPHCLFWWVLNLSDRIILQKFVSLNQVGIYSLGYNIGMGMQLIIAAFNKAWVPFLFSTAKKDENAAQIFSRLTTYYMMVIIFIGLSISFFSQEIVHLLTTAQYYEATKIVPVIVLSFIVIGMYMMVTNQIFYKKKTYYLTFISGVAATTNVILNFILIPKYGIMGAAYSTLISMVFFFVLTYKFSMKLYPVQYEKKRILMLFVLAFVLFFSKTQISIILLGSGMSLFFIKILFLLSFPLALFCFKYFNDEERMKIKNFIKNIYRRLFRKIKQ